MWGQRWHCCKLSQSLDNFCWVTSQIKSTVWSHTKTDCILLTSLRVRHLETSPEVQTVRKSFSDSPMLLEGSAKNIDTELESESKSYTFEILFIKNIDTSTAIKWYFRWPWRPLLATSVRIDFSQPFLNREEVSKHVNRWQELFVCISVVNDG